MSLCSGLACCHFVIFEAIFCCALQIHNSIFSFNLYIHPHKMVRAGAVSGSNFRWGCVDILSFWLPGGKFISDTRESKTNYTQERKHWEIDNLLSQFQLSESYSITLKWLWWKNCALIRFSGFLGITPCPGICLTRVSNCYVIIHQFWWFFKDFHGLPTLYKIKHSK